ncbi:hypothetical protein CAEBREN_29228 [Caenorhabditis brenneri]|uniref:Decapping nuclease n=1 Tax=Caenorhabditis brenneri TaxID=135651 RepID=G0PIX9_CAEBE|nr:hypothetical protein CAEBREN_29228 [Caenorhabditis brenneri]
MEEIEVDPWIRKKIDVYDVYSIIGVLYSIPFVIIDELTLRRSREKFMKECRMIPCDNRKIIDEKSVPSLDFEPPIDILGSKMTPYLKGSSSQHMCTILDGIDDAGYTLEGVDVLVASETLHKIAGAVFHQETSWKLRAYLETVQNKKMIVLCDDDQEKIETGPARRFEQRVESQRLASLKFAQAWSQRGDLDPEESKISRITNPLIHGSRLVLANLKCGSSTLKMAVVGEVDMCTAQQSVNTAVMTGRPHRVNLGSDPDDVLDSFEYLWSRCFWIGLTNCLIGMRSDFSAPVKTVHRFDIKEYYHTSRKRFDNLIDVSTNCVAQVMNRLKEAVESVPNSNWIVQYVGRDEEFEPNNIKISKAPETHSFWLIREYFQIAEYELVTKKNQTAMAGKKNDVIPRVVHCPQQKRSRLSKIRTDTTDFAKQFHRLLKHITP